MPAFLARAFVLLALLSAPLSAQIILSGQVVDPQGFGVAGIDIDVLNVRGGGDPDIFNDGTNASGFFNMTVQNAGVFDIRFTPPGPPTTTLLRATIPSVVVTGSADLGVIQLEQGVRVQGRTLNPFLQPVAGVKLEIIDVANDVELDLPTSNTNLFGQFDFTAPAADLELRLRTSGVLGQTLANTAIDVSTLSGVDTNLGDVVLPPGFHLRATVVNPGGQPVANLDTDTFDKVTGEKIWTPGDSSNAFGQIDLVLPFGLWDVALCPAPSTSLAPQIFLNVNMFADLNVGTQTLPFGHIVSGTVRDGQGLPIAGVDIDANNGTGGEFFLCQDGTNAQGFFSVVVPVGTTGLEFTPSYQVPFGSFETGPVNGPLNLAVTLPDCPGHVTYGTGLAGKGGFIPTITSTGGSARLGNDKYGIVVNGARGGARAVALVGYAEASTPFRGGTLHVAGGVPPDGSSPGFVQNIHGADDGNLWPIGFDMLFFDLPGAKDVAGAGNFVVAAPIPNLPILNGLSRFIQLLVKDRDAVQGWAMSPGMRITFCD